MQKGFVGQTARDFDASEGLKLQEYFVYFKISNCTIVAKDPAYAGKAFPTHAQRKRERGDSSPRTQSPVSPFCCPYAARNSGGQNLAALSAAAGENLAAVSSGHSLAEAMNLGAMTLGGLIGTLH